MNNDWKALGARLVALGLPVVGGALKGAAGAMVGRQIAEAIVGRADASAEEVGQAVTAADPETLVALAKIEQDRQREGNIEVARLQALEAADLAAARTAHKGHWMPSTLTLIYVALLVTAFGLLMFRDVPQTNRDVIFLIVGAILARFTQGGDYWLGSSRGSADKQRELMTKN